MAVKQQKKRQSGYDRERERAKREAGVKQIVITVPDLTRAVPGGIGEGAYLRIDVVLPRWRNRAIYSQFYAVNSRRKRIELVEDFTLMKDDVERLRNAPQREITDQKFLGKVVELPAEYRSREKAERDIEKVAGLFAMQPDHNGTIERVLTLQEQAERATAAPQPAVTQPAQPAVTQPAQPAQTA